MTNHHRSRKRPDEPAVYQIRIAGHLGEEWSGWFQGMSITLNDHGQTLVTGTVADQAALHGLLKKVRDLGLPLLSVTRLDRDQGDFKHEKLADDDQH
jgi:hypothetical protein